MIKQEEYNSLFSCEVNNCYCPHIRIENNLILVWGVNIHMAKHLVPQILYITLVVIYYKSSLIRFISMHALKRKLDKLW